MARLSLRRRDDEGIALVLVVGSMLVLSMLAMTALAYTLSSQKFARYDQDYSGSVTAAQSGIEDVISRLNRDDMFGAVVDCTNTAWKGPMDPASNTCGWGWNTVPGWLPVKPGETDPRASWFHYALDATSRASQGKLVVTATGRVNGVYRTVETTVGKSSSTDYVYYTDKEDADPSNVQAYPSGAPTVCGGGAGGGAKYFYEGRSGCTEITFIDGDVLNGGVFSNDAVLTSGTTGPTFSKGFESANPACKTVVPGNPSTWDNCLRSTATTANFNGVPPVYKANKQLADTSAAFILDPGCHYFGSTRVIFSNTGMMTVWNKKSVNGNKAPISIAPPAGTAPICGTTDQLDAVGGFTVAVPTEMVIYVAASTVPMRQCYGDIGGGNGGEIGGPAGATLPLGNYSATYAAGPTNSSQHYTADTNMIETTKFCGAGNLYVEGTLKGRVTVAAAQSVIATGDLVLAGGLGGTDMLGLVATNSVEVFHPRVGQTSVTGSSGHYTWTALANPVSVANEPTRYIDPTTGTYTPANGIQIAGSIQTLQHSFLVQKYAEGGAQGTLLVNGSIAQRWRGIVGQGTNGYIKLYQYDTRLQYTIPPYFPVFANSQWSLRYSGEMATTDAVRKSSP